MEEKILNEAEILSIKRLRHKGLKYAEIADRIGISVEQCKAVCNPKKDTAMSKLQNKISELIKK